MTTGERFDREAKALVSKEIVEKGRVPEEPAEGFFAKRKHGTQVGAVISSGSGKRISRDKPLAERGAGGRHDHQAKASGEGARGGKCVFAASDHGLSYGNVQLSKYEQRGRGDAGKYPVIPLTVAIRHAYFVAR